MKVAIAYKWAASPQEAEVSDSGAVDWSRAKAAFGEYDAVAAEVARRLVDAVGGELIGISVGGSDVISSLAKKGALSRGLDRAVLVGDAPESARRPLTAARALAALVRREGDVELVVTGDASNDVGAGVVSALLGAELGWPVIAGVSAVEPAQGAVRVTRAVTGGTEMIEVPLPAVVAAACDAVVPRVPGMKDILSAGKKPSEDVLFGELGVPAAPAPATAHMAKAANPARKKVVIDAADPDQAVSELVAALRAAGDL